MFRSTPKPAPILALLTLSALAITFNGCSEKPGDIVWAPAPAGVGAPTKVGVTSVVTLGPEEVVVVGFGIGEGSTVFQPAIYHRTAAGWTSTQAPGHDLQSFKLLSVTRASDGTLWACGATRGLDLDLGSSQPVMYRGAGDTWTEVSLAEAGDLTGNELSSIAAGPGGELRALGASLSEPSLVLRYAGGHWTKMTLPDLGPQAQGWYLNYVTISPTGIWYAVGGGTPGGVILADSGSGWRPQPTPAPQPIDIRAAAFDAQGALWIGGNYPVGDSAQGVAYKVHGAQFTPISIRLARRGLYQIYAMAFDSQGGGWVVGGRSPDDPFIAGNVGGAWSEVNVDTDLLPGTVQTGETGGELYSISLLGPDIGFTGGHAEESGFGEGGVDLVARLFKLTRKPVGEVDKPALALQPK